MQIIQSISIKNFRSIKSIENLKLSDLNIFTGENDHGKSNILRALNLFFNDETDLNQPFNFEDDYCQKAAKGKGQQRQIKIEIIIQPPKERFKISNKIKWTKTWTADGPRKNEKKELNSELVLKKDSKSNALLWLEKIKFRYIPAVKDRSYFIDLMGELHDTLNKTHSDRIRKNGENFISEIKTITEEITSELDEKIGIRNTLQVPSNFKILFSNLDFGEEKDGSIYYLKHRGDGIKNRHIPVILRHMAKAEQAIVKSGYVKPDTIWGFEEPENNLEISQAFKLGDELIKSAKSIQTIVSTHSPAIYAIETNKDATVIKYFVEKENELTNVKEILPSEIGNLKHKFSKNMGITQLVTPHMVEAYKTIENNKKQVAELENRFKTLKRHHPKLIVLTEDRNAAKARSREAYLKTLLKSNNIDIDEGAMFSPYNGSGNFNAAIEIWTTLKKEFNGAKILVHRDRDYNDIAEVGRWEEKIKNAGTEFSLFVTDGVDIESHFLALDHLAHIEKNLTKDELNELLDTATDQSKEISIDFFFEHEKKIKNKNDMKSTLVSELTKKYEANVTLYRHGKTVKDQLTKLINEKTKGKTKRKFNICQKSEALKSEKLLRLAQILNKKVNS